MLREPRAQPQFLEHACIATQMLSKRRQLFDLKDYYVAVSAEYDRKSELLRHKEDSLALREFSFQNDLVKFEAFSKENESKHVRASKKLAEEIYLWELKDKELEELLKILEEKKVEEKQLQGLVDRKMRYQDYLEASADELHLGPYTEVFDILNRYELLKQTRERTRQRLATLDAEIITHQEELEILHEQYMQQNDGTNQEDQNKPDKNQSIKQAFIDGRVNLKIAYIVERFEKQGSHNRSKRKEQPLMGSVNDRGDTDDPGAIIQTIDKISQFIQVYASIVEEWEVEQGLKQGR